MRIRLAFSLALTLALLAPTTHSGQRAHDPWLWSEEVQFTFGDNFAATSFSIAVSLDGDTALVGASDEDAGGYRRGAAYVFVRSGSGWTREARLVPGDPDDEDQFGAAVCVEGDTALIGAPLDDDAGHKAGSVYVFTRSAGVWSETAELTAPDAATSDTLGTSVAIAGNHLLVGAPGHQSSTGLDGGAVYVFRGAGATWSLHQKLVTPGAIRSERFGSSMDVSGSTALIAASSGWGAMGDTGVAYVFVNAGGSWVQQDKLYAPEGETFDRFGWSVALDGDRALIGAPSFDPTYGAAYVFTRSGTTWTLQQRLVASDAAYPTALGFGSAVGLDGETAMVGNNSSSHYDSAVYVFQARGTDWLELEKLSRSADILFGASISISGNQALIGEPLDHPNYAYIYSRPPDSGAGFCFGEPGSGTPCPCSNDNDGSIGRSGCDNGVFASGAQLSAYGDSSVAADEVLLRAVHVEPNNSGLFFQGTLQANGGAGEPFGNGLRCAGGQVVRLQVSFADEGGVARTTIPLAASGGVSPGDVRSYQYWYRTTTAPPCGPGVNDFNTSNGVSIIWTP